MEDCETRSSREVKHQPQHVLYLGPPTSFSHAAAQAVFPSAVLHAAPDFPSIFRDLQDSNLSPDATHTNSPGAFEIACDRAIIPVVNSTNGPVVPVIDLLRRTGDGSLLAQLKDLGIDSLDGSVAASKYAASTDYGQPESSVTLNGNTEVVESSFPSLMLTSPYTYALSVHHHLYVHPDCPVDAAAATQPSCSSPYSAPLASKSSTSTSSTTSPPPKSSSDFSSISSLHTHPQVWTQCRRFLDRHFPSLESESSSHNSSLCPSPSLTSPDTTPQDNLSCINADSPTPNTVVKRISHASTSDAALYVAQTRPSPHLHQQGQETNPVPQVEAQVRPSVTDPSLRPPHRGHWPAVICSRMAGDFYGLKCIANGIEDDPEGNRTTFVVLGKRSA